jgi:hypothetical protein
LISIIGSDPRVGMPQDKIVETTEILFGFSQKLCHPKVSSLMIKEGGITQHEETA